MILPSRFSLRGALVCVAALVCCCAVRALPVFPGAQGFGTQTPAGRGGAIYVVTNLNNSGPGSLRYGIENIQGPRVIVFEVSGVIELQDELLVKKPSLGSYGNLTIAGQTAPPPGITLKNAGIIIQASDVLIQHIAIRPGTYMPPDTNPDQDGIQQPPGWALPPSANRDCITISTPNNEVSPVRNVVIDHVSCSWGSDETASTWSDYGPLNVISDITFSNCIFSEGIRFPTEDFVGGYGLLGGRRSANISFVRNILALNWERNPLVRDTITSAQIVENFIYRPGPDLHHSINVGSRGDSNPDLPLTVSIVGNVVIKHPAVTWYDYSNRYATRSYGVSSRGINVVAAHAPLSIYLENNAVFNPSTNRWYPTDGDPYSAEIYGPSATPGTILSANPHTAAGVILWNTTPDVTEARLTASAGKHPAIRDAIDAGVINKIQTRTGIWVAFESELGTDPWAPVNIQNYRPLQLPENPNGDDDGDGYTNLEEWLHQMAAAVETGTNRAPVALAGPDQTIKVDAQTSALVTLDGSASFDYDGDDLTYVWSWSGGSASGAVVTVSLPLGVTEVTLTVSDGRGGVATDTVSIEIIDPPAVIALSHLTFAYSGEPRSATVSTYPEGLPVEVLYNGSSTPPTFPGVYTVTAKVLDPAYPDSTTGTLTILPTALVRHGLVLGGTIDGSVQVALPENTTLNGNAALSGDLLVPGTPHIQFNGSPIYGGTEDGPGNPSPSNYQITLNGGAHLGHVVRRVDPMALPNVTAPATPAGTRDVSLNQPGQSAGDFATLRNLTLNGNAGTVAVPPGTYGTFVANGNSRFQFGVAGATEPAAYDLQALTLNGSSSLELVGPVVLTVANAVTVNNGVLGSPNRPDWLSLRIASGGFTLNGSAEAHASIVAPQGTVTINGSAETAGRIAADRLVLNGNAVLSDASDRTPPSVALLSPAPAATLNGIVTLAADASDETAIASVQFTLDGQPIGYEDATAPFAIQWNTLTVADGVYTLAAIARDGAGNVTTSAPISITVQNAVRDDFEDGNADGWMPSGVFTWDVVLEDGNYVYRQTNLGGGAISLLGGTDWTDYTVQARAKAHVLPSTTETLMALWARSNGTNNHYTFQLLSTGNVALKKRVNGAAVAVLGTAPFPVELERWYDLKLEVFGSTLNAYVDGVLVLSRTDTSLPSGHAGVNTYRASASFDDVVVTPRVLTD